MQASDAQGCDSGMLDIASEAPVASVPPCLDLGEPCPAPDNAPTDGRLGGPQCPIVKQGGPPFEDGESAIPVTGLGGGSGHHCNLRNRPDYCDESESDLAGDDSPDPIFMSLIAQAGLRPTSPPDLWPPVANQLPDDPVESVTAEADQSTSCVIQEGVLHAAFWGYSSTSTCSWDDSVSAWSHDSPPSSGFQETACSSDGSSYPNLQFLGLPATSKPPPTYAEVARGRCWSIADVAACTPPNIPPMSEVAALLSVEKWSLEVAERVLCTDLLRLLHLKHLGVVSNAWATAQLHHECQFGLEPFSIMREWLNASLDDYVMLARSVMWDPQWGLDSEMRSAQRAGLVLFRRSARKPEYHGCWSARRSAHAPEIIATDAGLRSVLSSKHTNVLQRSWDLITMPSLTANQSIALFRRMCLSLSRDAEFLTRWHALWGSGSDISEYSSLSMAAVCQKWAEEHPLPQLADLPAVRLVMGRPAETRLESGQGIPDSALPRLATWASRPATPRGSAATPSASGLAAGETAQPAGQRW